MSEIKDLLKQLAEGSTATVVSAKVLTVDMDACTCDVEPLNGEADLLDVRLRAVKDGNKKGHVLFPVIGSIVLVAKKERGNTDAYVAMLSEVDVIQIDANQIVFNGGENGGLINIEALVSKINRVEGKLDSVINTLKAPAALGVPIDPVTLPIIVQTVRQDLEDTKVTH